MNPDEGDDEELEFIIQDHDYDSDEGDPYAQGINYLDGLFFLEVTADNVVNYYVNMRHPPPHVATLAGLVQSMRENGSLRISDRTNAVPRELFRLFCFKIETMVHCMIHHYFFVNLIHVI